MEAGDSMDGTASLHFTDFFDKQLKNNRNNGKKETIHQRIVENVLNCEST